MPIIVPGWSNACCNSEPAFAAVAPDAVTSCQPTFQSPDLLNLLSKQSAGWPEVSTVQRPCPQIMKSSFDATSNTHHTLWHADAKKLYVDDRSLVSPAFELSLPDQQSSAVFKCMISSTGNGFRKSKGLVFVK